MEPRVEFPHLALVMSGNDDDDDYDDDDDVDDEDGHDDEPCPDSTAQQLGT